MRDRHTAERRQTDQQRRGQTGRNANWLPLLKFWALEPLPEAKITMRFFTRFFLKVFDTVIKIKTKVQQSSLLRLKMFNLLRRFYEQNGNFSILSVKMER